MLEVHRSRGHNYTVGAVQPAVAGNQPHPGLAQCAPHVFRLLRGQAEQPLVDRRQIDGDFWNRCGPIGTARKKLHPQLAGLTDGAGGLCSGDERL